MIPFLSALEFDEAVKQLPVGDYAAERLAVLQERVRLERRAAYPPIEEYVYAVAEGDDAAVAAFKAKCTEVCCQCPMPWDASASYATGDLVTHNGVKYRKLDDGDTSAPDDVPGGWVEITNDNHQEFEKIEASFNSYEQRKADHKAEVLAKLAAEGLNPDDVKAVLDA